MAIWHRPCIIQWRRLVMSLSLEQVQKFGQKIDSAGQVVDGAQGFFGNAKQVKETVAPKKDTQPKPATPAASPAAQKTLEGSSAAPGTCDGPSKIDLLKSGMKAKNAEISANGAARSAQNCSEASAGCSMGEKVGKGIAAIPTPYTKAIGKAVEYGCKAGKMVADYKGGTEKQEAAEKGKKAQDLYTEYNEQAAACGEEQKTADLEDPNKQGPVSKANSAVNSVMGMFTQGTQAVQGMQGLFGKGQQAGGEAAAGQGGEAAAAGAAGQSGGKGGFMGMLGGLFGGGGSGAAGGAASGAGAGAAAGAGDAVSSMAGGASSVATAVV